MSLLTRPYYLQSMAVISQIEIMISLCNTHVIYKGGGVPAEPRAD